MTENRLGSAVAISGPSATVCRPDEFLKTIVAAAEPLTEADAEAFDLRPIQLGARYRDVLISLRPDLANCSNCAPWGPMVFEDQNVAVNRTGRTSVTAVDLGTLAELWTLDTEDSASALHGGPDGVYLELTGGSFLRLDPASGQEQWRIERDPDERNLGLSGHADDAWFVRSSFSTEGDRRPPLLRRIDIASGDVLWTVAGREETEWQSTRPVVLDGLVIVMDVPESVDGVGATLQAFDVETGGQVWITDLDSASAAFDIDLISVLAFENGSALIVRTVSGDLVRVDPSDGAILWRREKLLGTVTGTDVAADGSLAISVSSGSRGSLLVDPKTGENKAAPVRPGECPVTIPPEPGFTPPSPWNPTPNNSEMVWFGSFDLWTVLDRGGHTPRKSVWWSANFPGGGDERRPELEVVYERLDVDAEPIVSPSPGTNAYTVEDGWFMINGLEPNEPGCWRVTATYKGAELSYVFGIS